MKGLSGDKIKRLVFGLGRSGLGVIRYLKRKGLFAAIYDDRPDPNIVAWAEKEGFPFDPDPKPGVYTQIIASPGIPLSHQRLKTLAEGGAEIIGEAELVFRYSQTSIIGITGTVGKTSTTLFIAHLLKSQGLQALAGGNMDPPLSEIIEYAEVAVAELSSFQLERIHQFRPNVAVLLNLGVDHLDRHGTTEAYHQAKLNLIKNLTSEEALVYNALDPKVKEAAEKNPARHYPFFPKENPIETNLEAALKAVQAYLDLIGKSLNKMALIKAMKNLPQPPSRFQVFARKGDVVFIDDSSATKVDAVIAALKSAPKPIAWIMGGVDKGAPIENLQHHLRGVKVILAIGQDGPKMAKRLSGPEIVEILDKDGRTALIHAVEEGLRRLKKGSILLAPLAASFDQFKDYQDRAKAFREVVFTLGGEPLNPLST